MTELLVTVTQMEGLASYKTGLTSKNTVWNKTFVFGDYYIG